MNDLGEFLRVRRAQLTPEEVGLAVSGARRVAGLRREEVAVLAGVSADYYTRLEQGRERNPSGQVVDAIARALRLGQNGRWYAYQLAGLAPKPETPSEEVAPALRQLMDAFDEAVAYIINRRLDVLACNALAAALLSPLEDLRPMMTNLFHDPAARDLFDDWPSVARESVEALRLASPDNESVHQLIGELLASSNEFAELWKQHGVNTLGSTVKTFNHPVAGRLTLTYQTFDIQSAPGQSLLVGTPAQESLEALKRLT
ncbi:helix-turn-helix transcriptional regulator [Kribbella koreensis]|uniref:Helix-turn-helix transcriptional regulator n=1 Tax=Kribbella koreensis TaxID=57909 RepID=A0ABP4ALA7_9ACTN